MDTRYLEEDKAMGNEIAAKFGREYLPPKPTIEIEAPDAFPGDTVFFHNPRKCCNYEMDEGTVITTVSLWTPNRSVGHLYTIQPLDKKYLVRVSSVMPLDAY